MQRQDIKRLELTIDQKNKDLEVMHNLRNDLSNKLDQLTYEKKQLE